MKSIIKQILLSKTTTKDVFGSSLVIAYSLRLVRSSYTGAAIRVRRSSDNTSIDIGYSGGVLDVNSLITFCGVGDGFISIWYDQSGKAINAAQSIAAYQLTIVKSGVLNTINGKPSALATSSCRMDIPLAVFNDLTSATEYAVFNQQSGLGAAGNVGAVNDRNYASFADLNAYISFFSDKRGIFANYGLTPSLSLHTSVNTGASLEVYKNYISKGVVATAFRTALFFARFPEIAPSCNTNISEYIITSNTRKVAFEFFTDYYRFI